MVRSSCHWQKSIRFTFYSCWPSLRRLFVKPFLFYCFRLLLPQISRCGMPLLSTFGWNKKSSLLYQIRFLSNGWESWFSFQPMRKFLDLNVNNRGVLRKWPSVSSRYIIWSSGRKDETKSAFWLVMRMISLQQYWYQFLIDNKALRNLRQSGCQWNGS